MNAREEAAKVLRESTETTSFELAVLRRLTSQSLHLSAIDEDLQKLRKESRTRNSNSEYAPPGGPNG